MATVPSTNDYITLVADTMQTSLVQLFGDPADAGSHSRFLAANFTNSSGVLQKLNSTINITSDVYNELVCWRECDILYPLITDNQQTSPKAMAKPENNTVCWDKCTDVVVPESLHLEGNSRCYNECLTLDPDLDSTMDISTNVADDVIPINDDVTTSDTNTSFILFNSTSNVTDSAISGIYFNNARSVTKSTIRNAVDTNEYDVVCWKECPLVLPTMAPTMSPTLRPWREVLKGAETNSSELDESEWNPNNLSDGEILRQTLTLYGTFFVICFVTFCIARKCYPRPFNLRSGWVDEDVIKSNPRAKRPQDLGWFSWFWKIWLISDTELSDECGMDALCLSRVLEWGVRITAFGSLVGCAILMPVYATAGGVHDGQMGIERLNTSNVPDGNDADFVATVVSAYLIFGYVMYTTLDEFEWFYKFRYEFLSRPIPRNYVIYVRNLDTEYRTKKALVEYFSHFEDHWDTNAADERVGLLSNNKENDREEATKAWVALKIPNLRKLVEKRAAVLSKLEHHINIQEVQGKFPKTRCEKTGVIVTVVDALFNELKDLNAQIKLAIERIDKRARLDDPREYAAEDYQNPYEVDGSDDGEYRGGHQKDNLTSNVFFDTNPTCSADADGEKKNSSIYVSAREPSTSWDEEQIATAGPGEYMEEGDPMSMEKANEKSDFSDSEFSSSEMEVTIISNLHPDGNSDSQRSKRSGLRKIRAAARTSMVVKQVEKVGKVAGTAVKDVGKGVVKVADTAVGAVETGAHFVVGQATNVVGSLLGPKDDDGAPKTAGFVAFSTLKACQAAKQMSHSNEVFGMEVIEAPGYDDIYWHNVGKTHKELQLGVLLSYCLTAVLCVSWTAITAAIAALSSVQGLTAIVPVINDWLEAAPWLESVLAQISPLMIVIADEVLKIILDFLSRLEGPVSGMVVEASLLTKIIIFKIIQTFFVNAASGSLISQLSAIKVIATNPGTVVTLLANALPNRSAFFIQILLVDTFVSLSMELLRISVIVTAIIRSFLGPKLTEDERRTTWMGLRPLADPYFFRYAENLGGSVLYFVVFFVYATLAPITSVFMFMCFLIMGAAYRHQFIFIYPTVPDSGGKLWIQFMKVVPTSLFIAEATMIGFLAAKSAPVASALMIPLVGITVLFNIYIRQKHFKATDFLPGCRCVEEDLKNNMDGPMDLRFISNHYLQPELRDKELYPKNATLAMQLRHGMIEGPEDNNC